MALAISRAVLCLAHGLVLLAAADPPMPLPWTRTLELTTPPQNGQDVFIAQNLLQRVAHNLRVTSVFDSSTEAAVEALQRVQGLPVTGVFDASAANALLECCSGDDYTDDGAPPRASGHKYKVHIQVYANRSIERIARLLDADGTEVYNFQVRLHGVDIPANANVWPYFNSSGDGLNQFSDDGDTPTGLMEFDLNSPEDDPKEFGPYPVNRAVLGLRGNAAWLISNSANTTVRNGILMHTGAWANYSDWRPPMPMPNSLGCIHAWPASIESVWNILVGKLGVEVRPNTDGALPYPYRPQGLLSVEQLR